MKTNPLTSKLRDFYASISKHRLAVAIIALLLFFLLISLVACKSPATLTNDTQHRTRDSNYHATVHRIETHDTIIIGTPSFSPLKGEYSSLPLREGQEGSKSPLKTIKRSLKGKVLMVLYTVFNGE